MARTSLHIAAPCDEDWSAMSGDDAARACARCQKRVFDTSELHRELIKDLLARQPHGQPPCLRIVRDANGDLITRDTKDEWLAHLLHALSGRGREAVHR